MDVKVNAGCLTQAIATDEIVSFASVIADELRQQVVTLTEQFAGSDPTPHQTLDLENTLHDCLREFGRKAVRWLFSRLEPGIEQMPGTLTRQNKPHRRLADKSPRGDVLG